MEAAQGRARRNMAFWGMVFRGNGPSYTELNGMDLAEFAEAVEARILFDEMQKEGDG